MTRRLPAAERASLEEAVERLRAGVPVAFPTDTVYGVGARAFDPAGIEALYRLKGRPRSKAIPVLVASWDQVRAVAAAVPEAAWRLAERFWPGGLTLVLPARPQVPAVLRAGGSTVAVRWPDHPTPQALARLLGEPLAATSANRSGGPNPRTADEVLEQLPDLALILDGGPCPGGTPSSVLDLTTDPPRLLREGAIPRAALVAAVGRVEG